MKTGFTDEAGYCFVASARRDGVEVIVVIMGDISNERRWRMPLPCLTTPCRTPNRYCRPAAWFINIHVKLG